MAHFTFIVKMLAIFGTAENIFCIGPNRLDIYISVDIYNKCRERLKGKWA